MNKIVQNDFLKEVKILTDKQIAFNYFTIYNGASPSGKATGFDPVSVILCHVVSSNLTAPIQFVIYIA